MKSLQKFQFCSLSVQYFFMNTVLRAQRYKLNLIQNYFQLGHRETHACGLLLENLNIEVSILLLSKYLQNEGQSENMSQIHIEIGLA